MYTKFFVRKADAVKQAKNLNKEITAGKRFGVVAKPNGQYRVRKLISRTVNVAWSSQ